MSDVEWGLGLVMKVMLIILLAKVISIAEAVVRLLAIALT